MTCRTTYSAASGKRSHNPADRAPSRGRGLQIGANAAISVLAAVTFSAILAAGGWSKPGATEPAAPSQAVPEPEVDGPIALEFARFALNALLVTLLDDDEPPRWSSAALSFVCGPETRVEVDGRPLSPGEPIPARAFAVRWHMDQCAQIDAFDLSGTVELLVFHEDTGLSAVVSPEHLIASSVKGVSQLRAPFAASMALSATSKP